MNMHNAMWQLISQSDLISKFILLSLLFMSILCWALTIYKLLNFKTKIQQLNKIQNVLNNINSLDEFIAKSSVFADNFAGQITAQYLADFKMLLKSYEKVNQKISEKDLEILQLNINKTIDDVLQEEEYSLPVLSTSAQAAPLIGLFGTVWGLIHAFLGIGSSKSADIAAVAPGIAEALITTLSGLIVAIPALIMFHYLQSKVQIFEKNLIDLSNKCLWIFRSAILKLNFNSKLESSVLNSENNIFQRDTL